MTPEQKIANVEAQIKAAEQGRTNILNCPYCGAQNKEDAPSLCCETLSIVVLATLDRWAVDDERRRFEQIYENVN